MMKLSQLKDSGAAVGWFAQILIRGLRDRLRRTKRDPRGP